MCGPLGPLAEWERRLDILAGLSHYSLDHVVEEVLGRLSSSDLRQARLVSEEWRKMVNSVWDHRYTSNYQINDK